MNILVNGIETMIPHNVKSVDDLLIHLTIGDRRVIVEWNKQILKKDDHEDIKLNAGDRVEIVHFVGGG
ncbi:thiamine biosynthesis protein ThiS [Rossellomorea marisflavi]|uniref:Thiamine biosynthesis protein ThiS n=1 Tax=Rossellomorea marisflavi TaxID=189381 RepID=A0A0M0GPJ9_9BACI|nr:sulfur carrier protein ThiS [Rossellomorea marisflavi]KON91774.1 thiamine biosynthesis protein ThiS [Rossellomorea marisflavi]MCM2589236.1 sulfur carrier protein ThiS [Rossellomorea marisflavi]